MTLPPALPSPQGPHPAGHLGRAPPAAGPAAARRPARPRAPGPGRPRRHRYVGSRGRRGAAPPEVTGPSPAGARRPPEEDEEEEAEVGWQEKLFSQVGERRRAGARPARVSPGCTAPRPPPVPRLPAGSPAPGRAALPGPRRVGAVGRRVPEQRRGPLRSSGGLLGFLKDLCLSLWWLWKSQLKSVCGSEDAGERQLLRFTCGALSLRWICTKMSRPARLPWTGSTTRRS